MTTLVYEQTSSANAESWLRPTPKRWTTSFCNFTTVSDWHTIVAGRNCREVHYVCMPCGSGMQAKVQSTTTAHWPPAGSRNSSSLPSPLITGQGPVSSVYRLWMALTPSTWQTVREPQTDNTDYLLGYLALICLLKGYTSTSFAHHCRRHSSYVT